MKQGKEVIGILLLAMMISAGVTYLLTMSLDKFDVYVDITKDVI